MIQVKFEYFNNYFYKILIVFIEITQYILLKYLSFFYRGTFNTLLQQTFIIEYPLNIYVL